MLFLFPPFCNTEVQGIAARRDFRRHHRYKGKTHDQMVVSSKNMNLEKLFVSILYASLKT